MFSGITYNEACSLDQIKMTKFWLEHEQWNMTKNLHQRTLTFEHDQKYIKIYFFQSYSPC